MKLQETYVDKWFNKLSESLLTEGTHYDKKAIKILVDSGLWNEEVSTQIIDGLFKQDIHAFVHSPAWLEKYLVGIARMIVEEVKPNPANAQQFLTDCVDVFEDYLEWIKVERPKASDTGKSNFDHLFNDVMSYDDVVEEVKSIKKRREAESNAELQTMQGQNNGYEIIPIYSYEQMHELFGGHLTGDGSSDKYAGGGGTAWCHTNSRTVYDDWVKNGENKFFVLAKNNWENIHFNAETSQQQHGKDEYGNSLIAILVNSEGELLRATLRGNHEGTLIGSADHQYQTYAELSKLAGFNVKDKIFNLLDIKPLPTLSVKDLDIKDITLLSIEEAEQIPKKYRTFYDWWWLRSPGPYQEYAAIVYSHGQVYSPGLIVSFDNMCVRPALILSNLKSFNLPIYSEVELVNADGMKSKWRVISDNMLLCNDKSFGKRRFDSKSNDYETSEIRRDIRLGLT